MRWGIFVRLFHWFVASGIIANYWFLEDGETAHEWLGYTLCALAVLRIAWGVVGPRTSRFSAFLRSPAAVYDEVLRLRSDYTLPQTHTAAGGYQLVLVLGLLLGIGLTGWIQELDAFWGEEWPQSLHEWLADALMVVAIVHISTIAWLQYGLRLPVIQRMGFSFRK